MVYSLFIRLCLAFLSLFCYLFHAVDLIARDPQFRFFFVNLTNFVCCKANDMCMSLTTLLFLSIFLVLILFFSSVRNFYHFYHRLNSEIVSKLPKLRKMPQTKNQIKHTDSSHCWTTNRLYFFSSKSHYSLLSSYHILQLNMIFITETQKKKFYVLFSRNSWFALDDWYSNKRNEIIFFFIFSINYIVD